MAAPPLLPFPVSVAPPVLANAVPAAAPAAALAAAPVLPLGAPDSLPTVQKAAAPELLTAATTGTTATPSATPSSGLNILGVQLPPISLAGTGPEQIQRLIQWTTRWQSMYPRLASSGYSSAAVQPVVVADLDRLAKGESGLSDDEIFAAVQSFQTPNSPTAPVAHTSMLSRIKDDITGIATSLPDLPANLFLKEPARVLAVMEGKWSPTLESQGWLQQVQEVLGMKAAPALTAGQSHLPGWANMPGLRMIPGYSTIASLVTGQGEQLLQHPVYTLLDVLGGAEGASELLGVDNPVAALKNLPLPDAIAFNRAVRRIVYGREAPLNPTVPDLKTAVRGMIESRLQGLPLGGAGKRTGDISRAINLDNATMLQELSHEGVTNEVVSRMSPDAQAALAADPYQIKDLGDRLYKLVTGTDDASLDKLQEILRDPSSTAYSPDPEVQSVLQYTRDIATRARETESALSTGRPHLTRLENVSPDLDGLWYSTSSRNSVGRKFLDYNTLRDKDHAAGINPDDDPKVEAARKKVEAAAKSSPPAQYQPALRQLAARLSGVNVEVGQMVIDPADRDLFKSALDDVSSQWLRLRQAGFDPAWVHETPVRDWTTYDRPHLRTDREVTPAFVKQRATMMNGDYMPNLNVALTDTMKQTIEKVHTQAFLTKLDDQYASDGAAVYKEYADFYPKASREQLMRRIDKEMPVAPDNPFHSFQGRRLPKQVADLIHHSDPRTLEGFRSYRAARGLYVASVLGLSPAYVIHSTLGGFPMLLARTGPSVLKYLGQAWDLAKAGRDGLPIDISLGHLMVDNDDYGQALTNYMKGRTLGRVMLEKVKKPEEFTFKVAGFAERMYKAMAYLYGRDNATNEGADADTARAAGINLGNSVLHDWYRQTPLEKSVIREIFPFYGFQKAVVTYALTYPMDHPLRAATMANSQRIIEQDSNQMLPQSWEKYLGLGAPNPLTGALSVLPSTSLNPFASASSLFTLAGIFDRTNPLITQVLESAGWTPPSASAELFPQLSYSASTGGLVVAQPGILGRIGTGIINIFPQADAIAEALKLTSADKAKAATDPQSWVQDISQKLGLPLGLQFSSRTGLTPMTVYPTDEMVKTQGEQWTALSNAFAQATSQGIAQPLTPYFPDITDQQVAMMKLLQIADPKDFSAANELWILVARQRAAEGIPTQAGPLTPVPTNTGSAG